MEKVMPRQIKSVPGEDAETIKLKLQALCRAYMDSDQWGRDHIMDTAIDQASMQAAHRPSGTLRLVTQPFLDKSAHTLDGRINSGPLSLVGDPVDTK